MDAPAADMLPGREFFVTVVDGGRHGFLLGPYEKHSDALAQVDRGRTLAQGADPRGVFYGYGTASAPVGDVRKTVFGK